MTSARKVRVPMGEQIRLINECRQSGMTDADWCRENDISVSTFYNWVSRCRKAAADQIPPPNYGHCEIPRSKQDVVPIDIVSDHLTEQNTASQMHLATKIKLVAKNLNLDNKCFQQSWKHHNKAVIKMAAVSEILVLQKIRLVLPHGSHASLIHVCIGKAVFVRSFYVWLQNRIHQKECLALAWCK